MKTIYDFYKNKKILITGHTGFKGSWLSIWLNKIGSELYGISLKPEKKSIFNQLNLKTKFYENFYTDIRNYKNIKKIIKKINPEIIFHLAAQPLVKISYENPILSFETNILGTANILEAAKKLNNLKSVIVITSDKCYMDRGKKFYKENDQLGGKDPYSASKAAAEIVTKSYYESFYKFKRINLSTVRAGNVIGGGDWSNYRLIPDIISSIFKKKELILRNPKNIRPWQHVLEPIYGYLLIGLKNQKYSSSWNFGPESKNITVLDIIKKFEYLLKKKIVFKIVKQKFYETKVLNLSVIKSKKILSWQPFLGIDKSLKFTLEWYLSYFKKENMYTLTLKQIESFEDIINKKQ